jgi:hypothetical protein
MPDRCDELAEVGPDHRVVSLLLRKFFQMPAKFKTHGESSWS